MSLLGGAVGFAIYGFAKTGARFVFGVPVMALWGFYGPAVQSLMTRRAAATEQGQLQGALSSLTGIANVFAPYFFSTIFAAALTTFQNWHVPGAPFLVASLLLLISLALGLNGSAETQSGP